MGDTSSSEGIRGALEAAGLVIEEAQAVVIFPMLAPLGIAHILLAVTLLWKGMRA